MPDEPPRSPIPASTRLSRWTLLWIACWVVLFTITHVPTPRGVRLPAHSDKVIHFVSYFVLAFLGARAAVSRGTAVTSRWALLWAGIYLAYGVADELIQDLVGRTCSLTDWLADAAGVACATLIVLMHGQALGHRHDEPDERGT